MTEGKDKGQSLEESHYCSPNEKETREYLPVYNHLSNAVQPWFLEYFHLKG